MTPSPDEPFVLVNLFSMSAEMADRFVAAWEPSVAGSVDAPGFRGTRLHRALDPDAPFPVINIARWDSSEDWQAAVAAAGWNAGGEASQGAAVRAQPALYRLVHSIPDPQER